MNVLLISVDSLRFDRVGCLYKNKETLTPHTDALGLNGARFLNNFTVSNGSLPSHTSIFTGLYPQHHGIRENGLQVPQHLQTLAGAMKSKGHATAASVSSVLLDSIYGLNNGFDMYYDTSQLNWLHHYLSKIGYKKYNISKALVHFGIHDGRSRSWTSVNNDALSWLARNDKPFFMFLHYMDIHRDTAGGTKTIREKHTFYDDNVKLADTAIGEIVAFLKDKKIFDQTIIVIFSDHGETLDDGKGHGNSVANDEFHTPLIMHLPGVVPSTDVTALTRTIDIMPTVLGLFDAAVDVDGKDVRSCFTGGHVADEVFMESYPPYGDIKAVATKQWKYVLSDGQKEELYDCEHDADEKINLIHDEKDTCLKLKRKLKQHFRLAFTQQELDDITKERLRGLGYLD
ncbi:MAG TPA: sulfatase [Candidatus Nanoarchaeia archaeon]|nr:sulfatase [Candidatus Nanoarchaeia archaeon]